MQSTTDDIGLPLVRRAEPEVITVSPTHRRNAQAAAVPGSGNNEERKTQNRIASKRYRMLPAFAWTRCDRGTNLSQAHDKGGNWNYWIG